jgi:hypothetical protein
MLEILAIYFLGKGVGNQAERKGLSGSLFTLLFIGLWFIGEAIGFVIGLNANSDKSGSERILAAYPLALVFAILGAGTTFMVVVIWPVPYSGPRRKRRSRRREEDGDDGVRYIKPSRRRPYEDDEDDRDYEPRPRRRRPPDDNEEERDYEPRPRRRRPPEDDVDDRDRDDPRRPRRRPPDDRYRDRD